MYTPVNRPIYGMTVRLQVAINTPIHLQPQSLRPADFVLF